MLSAFPRHARPCNHARAVLRGRTSGGWRALGSQHVVLGKRDKGVHDGASGVSSFPFNWSQALLFVGSITVAGVDGCVKYGSKCEDRASTSSILTLKVTKGNPNLLGEASKILSGIGVKIVHAAIKTDAAGETTHQYTIEDESTGQGLSSSKLTQIQEAFKVFEGVESSAMPWPIFTSKEVSEHNSVEKGIWVSFKDGVYDITNFIANHPGGQDKIMLAAGKAIDPFWRIYQQHESRGTGIKALADMRIGDLADPPKAGNLDDPYDSDPHDRHPGLIFHNTKPCNAELPPELMLDSWVTPNPVWFIRHHHPVPVLDIDKFRLHVEGPGTKPVSLTMEDLKTRFLKREVTTTIQCGGNRRGEFNQIEKTSGIAWGFGAISTATFGGVYLREVLMHCAGLTLEGVAANDVKHVISYGLDDMEASIPIEKALSPFGDVLLAYEMNGEELPAEHGHPVRLVVPGVVGVRNVKWVGRICASSEEAEGTWQRGAAYKSFPPNVKSFDEVDISVIPSIQEMPVTSNICSPKPGTILELDDVEVKGFAWSGGGHGIIRVDVSLDDGLTWRTAELKEGGDQHLKKAWAWTFWEATLEIPEELRGKELSICCRATDSSCNVQPETAGPIWNLRGLNNNSWHRVKVKHSTDDE